MLSAVMNVQAFVLDAWRRQAKLNITDAVGVMMARSLYPDKLQKTSEAISKQIDADQWSTDQHFQAFRAQQLRRDRTTNYERFQEYRQVKHTKGFGYTDYNLALQYAIIEFRNSKI